MTERGMRRVEELSPSEIEARSMEIITQELAAREEDRFRRRKSWWLNA